jgi:hypothetical protein
MWMLGIIPADLAVKLLMVVRALLPHAHICYAHLDINVVFAFWSAI